MFWWTLQQKRDALGGPAVPRLCRACPGGYRSNPMSRSPLPATPPRPTRDLPAAAAPSRAFVLFWGRFVPGTLLGLGLGLAHVLTGWPRRLRVWPRPTRHLLPDDLALRTFWWGLLAFAVLVGLATVYCSRLWHERDDRD